LPTVDQFTEQINRFNTTLDTVTAGAERGARHGE
jgi:hypothetical protein